MANNTSSQDAALAYVKAHPHDRRFVYWMGGVRAGKSYGAAMCFMADIALRPCGARLTYLVLGYTSPQVQTIYSDYLTSLAKAEGYSADAQRATVDPHVLVRDDARDVEAKFLFRGADSERKAAAIQGLTVHGLLADEVGNLNRQTVHQAEARCSEGGALRVYTTNKTSPHHWTTKYYADRLREHAIKGLLLDCSLEDNPHVQTDYLEEREAEYEGETLDRFIRNEFTLDDEPLYRIPTVDPAEYVVDAGLCSYALVYAHDSGAELVTVEQTGAPRYTITGARSYTQEQGVSKLIEDLAVPAMNIVLINSDAVYASRQFRQAKVADIRAYCQPGYGTDAWRIAVMQEAIRQDLLAVDQRSAKHLLEPLDLYSADRAGRPEHPIINAVESMADILRYQL